MKVLSVKNPWAWLMFYEGKDVENRTYATKVRGDILIHASKQSMPYWSFYDLLPARYRNEDDNAALRFHQNSLASNGHILGAVELVDCVQDSQSEWAEEGCWHWIIQNPRLCQNPIPAKGMLGFWEYKTEVPYIEELKHILNYPFNYNVPHEKYYAGILKRVAQ